jgi:uncharacterized protein YjbI with pentapeptide repeats
LQREATADEEDSKRKERGRSICIKNRWRHNNLFSTENKIKLKDANMANEEHLKLLHQGVQAWNNWRNTYPDVQPDLQEAHLTDMPLTAINFRKANLSGASFHKAILPAADMREANLQRASLASTNLQGANLALADLKWVDLEQANLISAVLRGADLRKANCKMAHLYRADLQEANCTETYFDSAILHQAYLQGTILRRAIFWQTAFSDVDLTKTIGLEECIHHGASSIDFRTLQYGPLPLAFLRGCGLPDTVIDYLPSLLNDPIQFYSCFISHSSKDEEFAQRLHADLQNKGVRCWFAPHDIQSGKKIHEQIDQAIRIHDKLLLILSEHSMQSDWVEFEIRKARKREVKEQKRVLFPVRLVNYPTIEKWECFDADTKKDLATEIREYYLPDFSHWKDHDRYKQEFDRLLRDLKAEAEKESKA